MENEKRQVMEIHGAALVIPEMTEEEFKSLKEDIERNGQIQPIITYKGQILDGRHRYRAATELGIEPKFQEVESGDDFSPMRYVLSLNVERRQLTTGQKAMIALDALPQFEKEAKENEAIRVKNQPRDESGKLVKADNKDKTGYPQAGGDSTTDKAARESAAKAAQLVGTSRQAVQRAKAIRDRATDLAKKVQSGSMALNAAYDQLKAREEAQKLAARDEETQEFLRERGFRRDDDPVMKSALEEVHQTQLAVDLRKDMSKIAVSLGYLKTNLLKLDLSVFEDPEEFFGERLTSVEQKLNDIRAILQGIKNFEDEVPRPNN